MFTCMKINLSNRFIAMLIVGVLIMITFACFTTATNDAHIGEGGAVCELVMSLADNAIVQTGFVLLIVIAAAWLGFNSGIFATQSELSLRLIYLYRPTLFRQMSPREHSYLSQLFSAGIIHSKVHSITV